MLSFKTFLIENFTPPAVDEGKIKEYYARLLPKLNQVNGKFNQVVRASLPKRIVTPDTYSKAYNEHPVFLSNIKTPESVISKVKRGKKVEDIGDLVRGAVLLPSHEAVEQFVKDFMRKNHSIIEKHEIKAHGSDKTYGYYGSQHLDLVIDGLRVELQVMTQKLWKMKEVAHGIYNKTRESPRGTTESDKIQSKNLFKTGNKPKFRHEDIENINDDEMILEFLIDNDRWKDYL